MAFFCIAESRSRWRLSASGQGARLEQKDEKTFLSYVLMTDHYRRPTRVRVLRFLCPVSSGPRVALDDHRRRSKPAVQSPAGTPEVTTGLRTVGSGVLLKYRRDCRPSEGEEACRPESGRYSGKAANGPHSSPVLPEVDDCAGGGPGRGWNQQAAVAGVVQIAELPNVAIQIPVADNRGIVVHDLANRRVQTGFARVLRVRLRSRARREDSCG